MPSPRPPYRVAIIGTGSTAHARAAAVAELPERARLVAVADLDRARAADFADRFSVPRVFDDPKDLLDGEQLDLVHVCTPPHTHASPAALAMQAGATALVEKPTTLSLRKTDHLADVQEQTGEHWRFTAAPGHEEPAALWSRGGEPDVDSGHRLQAEAVFDAWDAGREAGVSLCDARRTLEFAAATYAPAFRGAHITAGELSGGDPFTLSTDGDAVPWQRVKEART